MYIYYPFVFNLCEETISRTDEGQPRPKYIFNKCGTIIYCFTLQRFGPSPSPNFKLSIDMYGVKFAMYKVKEMQQCTQYKCIVSFVI